MLTRHAAIFAAGMLVLAACGTGAADDAVPVARPTPIEVEETGPVVPAAHLDAIATYWDQREAAFVAGARAGVEFVVSRLARGLDYSAEDCMEAWFAGGELAGFVERNTLDEASVAPATDWVMTIGAREIPPTADAYRMEVELAYEGVPGWWPDRRVAAYVEVDGADVRNFVRCETAQVAASSSPALRAEVQAAPEPVETLVGTTSVRMLLADGGVSAASTPECPNPRIEIRGDTAFIFCPSPSTGGSAPGQPSAAPSPEPTEPTGTRPSGTGMDFCKGDGGEREQGGDYYVCGTDHHEPREPGD